MTPAAKTQLICRLGRALGFDRVGVTAADPVADAGHYRVWLENGYAGDMAYLSRNQALRADPRLLLSGAKSIICVAVNYARPPVAPPAPDDPPSGRIAAYARGADYHRVLKEMLAALETQLRSELPEPFQTRRFADTGPLLERSLAASAGLGWIGKNTLLLHPELGSYLFLGELITTLELEPTAPATDHCGTCTRCLDACPTQAFPAPHVLDARRCIAYHTIENRGLIPDELGARFTDWVFGCDICQEVCPHNRRAPLATQPEIAANRAPGRIPLQQLSNLAPEEYSALTRDSALSRATPEMLRRNAQLAQTHHKPPS